MPLYLFKNPNTSEVIEIIQSMKEEHIYVDSSGLEWERVWVNPNMSTDSEIDPFSERDFAEKTKTDENRRKIGPTTLRERAERKQLDFFACRRDSASILVASALSGAFPSASLGVPGRPWGLSWSSRRSPETLPRRSETAPGLP